ncbi:MAG: hypothetical protein CVV37_07890 [Nitrospira bacterium HGW-Nitrospira-1]|nr:MAG: hypothetical protein CVV37_07890 [Nitrospira bacterium HGW-Nitrospira-1]
MRAPNIRKIVAFSALLHLTFLVLAIVLIKYSRNVVMPSPYTVSLVSPENVKRSSPSVSGSRIVELPASETEKSVKKSKTMIDTTKKNEQKSLNERMSELEAIAKLKRNKEIRTKIAEISGRAGVAKSTVRPSEKQGAAEGQKGTPTDMYIAKISDEIWREWIWFGEKELETVVSAIIRQDGTITAIAIEKSSGDLFFDRSVLKAVTKASPVSPPPYEMEIGIRFYP